MNLGPILGPFWVPFWVPLLVQFVMWGSFCSDCVGLVCNPLPCKVRGFWHWIDYLRRDAEACGKTPLFLNLDETSISQWWSQPKGVVALRPRWREGMPPHAAVPANRRRGAVTLCALLTHRTDVQPLLPQLVLGNRHVLPRAFCAQMSAAVDPSVHFWSERSGWMSQAVLIQYLSLLVDVLDGLPHLQGILVMDCAPAHMGQAVLEFAKDHGLKVCFVPAGCTGYLQPLDVGCFSPLKAFLRREARDVLSTKGSCPKLDWALAINKAAAQFLRSRRWEHVFCQCGILGHRSNLTGFMQEMAGKYAEVEPAAVAPSPHVIAGLVPRNRHVLYHLLFPQFCDAI